MKDIKALRDLTNAGLADIKKALQEAEGDHDKAVEILRSVVRLSLPSALSVPLSRAAYLLSTRTASLLSSR